MEERCGPLKPPLPSTPDKKKSIHAYYSSKLTQNAFSLAPTLDHETQYYFKKLYLPPFFLVKIKYNSG